MAATRKPRRIDLTLLLAVAPLVAGCGPEERHCVGEDGVYRPDADCETPAGSGATGGWSGSGSPHRTHWVYVPRWRYGGVGSHAGAYVHATSPGKGGGIHGTSRGGFGSTGAGHVSGS